MKYFKSFYDKTLAYSPNWYGTFDYAPIADVLLYNDDEGYCIGTINEITEDIMEITEEDALFEIENVDSENPNIWFGYRLMTRWETPEEQDVQPEIIQEE